MRWFLLFILFPIVGFVACEKDPASCEAPPLYLNFSILSKDSSDMISNVDTASFIMYYLSGNTKIIIKHKRDAEAWRDYYVITTFEPVKLSAAQAVSEFYVEYANKDIDTINLLALKNKCRYQIHAVTFNKAVPTVNLIDKMQVYIFKKK